MTRGRALAFGGLLVAMVAPAVLFPSRATSGDEPHYLLVTNSLLHDRDLELQEDYRRVEAGGADAGVWFRGVWLHHHTIVVGHGLWLKLACVPPGAVEVPAHPPAFPAMLALLVVPFRPAKDRTEHFAGVAVALLAWLAAVATFAGALRAGLTPRRAAVAAGLLVASPWLAYARGFYSEIAIGLALALGFWALQAGRPGLAAAAAAAAAILKPPFALVGAAWIVERWWAGERRAALRMAAVLGAAGLALVAFNVGFAKTPVVAGAEGFVPARSLRWLFGTLFDLKHGLFVFVPWALVAAVDLRRWRAMLLPALPYLALVGAHATLGGFCYGPRYWIPFLPWFAIAAAGVSGRGARIALAGLAIATAAFALPAAVRYSQLFDQVPWAAWR